MNTTANGIKTYTTNDLLALGAFIFVRGEMRGIAGTKDGRAFVPIGSYVTGWSFRETTPARAAVFAVRAGLGNVLPSDVVECVNRRSPRFITRLA